MKRFLTALALGCVTAMSAAAQDLPVVRAAVLKIGTVNWELSTIVENGLDEKHGFTLEMVPYADNGATRIAVEGGEADMAVADWIWVARQRAEGKDYVVVPYSRAVGGLLVPEGSDVETLADLKGGKIGIAGGPLDKSWLILRAFAQQEYGMDLKADTEQVFGAPPLIFKSGLSGDYAGAINFWHFLAKMKAAGMRELISVETAAEALGLDPDVPLLGYYFKGDFLSDHAGLAQSFFEASRDAKDLLAQDPAAWEALRPQMNAGDDAQFEQLRDDWLAGVPARGPVDAEAAGKLLSLMAELGGAELVGQASRVPDGLFADVQ
ncbi:ABC transporter substrate-binding protein [Alloyangia pacifica]|uniref:NitT/TauT family transport system substrate-binding protein n=1 Tax=Alloyangia pacifica TaxID=311180 RepID=A0A1I6VFL8_9RHOB|nr:ABC transporter substrate-binding protein [Alloyangia pacifica]SDH95330.1 NitT/TauT family transport system substrate-binding protein [Alloyangia pacifica]SFT12420.1 NitT/TauT family transport system substrate-binding protein [Alloyangia pacifica]